MVTQDNFHIETKTTFTSLAYGLKAEQLFNELKTNHGLFFKSNSLSQYIVVNNLVYRYSNHWGIVATCTWNLNKKNYLQKTNQTFTLAVSPLEDFISCTASAEDLKVHAIKMFDKL